MNIDTSVARIVAVLKEEVGKISQEFDQRRGAAQNCRDFDDGQFDFYLGMITTGEWTLAMIEEDKERLKRWLAGDPPPAYDDTGEAVADAEEVPF